MLDWSKIVGFDWDSGNERKSVDKHGVGQGEAEQVFLNMPLLVLDDGRHSNAEPRFHALGKTDLNKRLHITFTLRRGDTLIRIISARSMKRQREGRL
jgi:uncharacterized protein